MEIIRCSSPEEFFACASSTEFRQRHELERHLARRLEGAESFGLPGYCRVDSCAADFLVDRLYGSTAADGEFVPNWRERLVCPHCTLNNRQRAVTTLIRESIARRARSRPRPSLYLMEQVTPIFRLFERTLTEGDLVGSEYLGEEVKGGEIRSSVRHENAERLSFAAERFDIVSSNDVFEHVNDPLAAFSEVFRVLRQGGELFLTIPFHVTKEKNVQRAEIRSGRLELLLEPEYHGNPLSPQGSLVFTDFGWEALEQLRSCGFADTAVYIYWSYEFGHLGGCQLFFHAVK